MKIQTYKLPWMRYLIPTVVMHNSKDRKFIRLSFWKWNVSISYKRNESKRCEKTTQTGS